MAPLPQDSETARLAVHLLGGLLVRRLGEMLTRPFQHRKTASLFAFLLLHPGRTYSRSFLAGTFWPDVDEEKARQSLRNSLVDIRKLLEPLDGDVDAILVSAKNTLQLQLAPFWWVDVWEFDDAVNASLRVPAASEDWFRALERAARVYRGPLLPDNEDDWCLLLREEQQARLIACLHDLASADRERRQYARACDWARQAVAIDPTDEESHRELMGLYYRMGERPRVLRQYQECREALRQIDAAPDERTLALYQRIRAQRPLQREELEPLPSEPDLRGPLVGRDRELGRLQQAWDRARSGRGELLLLTGEAGIGKSRLGQELIHDVEASGGLALYGQAYQSESHYLYQPLTDPLRRALQLIEEQGLTRCAPVWMRQVARLLPEIAQEDADLAQPEAESPGLLEGLTQFFLSLSVQRPVYLFLDDLQWGDAATGRFLQYLCRRTRSARLLVAGAYRKGEVAESPWLSPWVTEVIAQRVATSLPLDRLGEEEVLMLLEALAGGQAAEPFLRRLGSRLWEATQGNPLFVREQLRALFEEGWLVLTDEGRWRIVSERLAELVTEAEEGRRRESRVPARSPEPGARSPEPGVGVAHPRPLTWRLPLPETVQRVVEQRVARLREEDRHLLACATVFGRRFTVETLRRTMGWELEPTLSGVERLLTADVLQAQAIPSGLDFQHDMVREVVYEGLPLVRRQKLHGRVAETLEAIYGLTGEEWEEEAGCPSWFRPHILSSAQARAQQHASELAWHFHQAVTLIGPEKAARYYYLAGRRARALCAYEKAVDDLTTALSLLADLPLDAARLAHWGQIVEQLAPAHRGADQPDAAQAVLEDYITRCEQQNDGVGIVCGLTFLGQFFQIPQLGPGFRPSRDLFEQAIHVCKARGLHDWIAYPSSYLAWELVRSGRDLERAAALARESLGPLDIRRDALLLQRAHEVLMWVAWKQQDWAEVKTAFERSLDVGGPSPVPLQLMLGEMEEESRRNGEEARFQELCQDLMGGYIRLGLEPPIQQWYLAPAVPRTISDHADLNERFEAEGWRDELMWQDITGRSLLDRTSRSGWLGIYPAKGCDLWPLADLNAPRLMARVRGDFVAETRVELGQGGAVRAGLLVWNDEQNLVRLEILTAPGIRDELYLQTWVRGRFRLIGRGQFDRVPTWLRVERIGEELRCLCSTDKERWLTAGSVHMPQGDTEQVGLAAIYVYSGTPAWFDTFSVWQAKLG